MQNLIANTASERGNFINAYSEAVRYYKNQNDITNRNNGKSELKQDGKDDPLRHADNRVSHNFYQLLVDQEAGYFATVAPQVDVGNDTDNQKILDILGDDFGLTIHNLSVSASNAGRAWLHYWIDEDNNFRYGIVPPDQITAIWSSTLDHKLLGVLRSYQQLDPDTGKTFTVHEYWNDKQGQFFKEVSSNPLKLESYDCIPTYDSTAGYETGLSDVVTHDFGRVPFIEFAKNELRLPELHKTKGLIDAYDDIYNGFLNDIDDIQQVVLVLKNYGGTKLDDFMENLKKNKVVKFNNAGNGDQSGIDTLQIEIPVEARDKVLTLTKSNIFLQGQGIDPANFANTNASGVAIKMLYSHLELKASKTEAYFRRGVSELVRAIMRYCGISDYDGRHIIQTWTRTQVEDNLTQAQTVATVAPYTSKETIAKANPLVEDYNQELKYQQDDLQNSDGFMASKDFANSDDYSDKADDEKSENKDKPDDE
ncbi:Putative phage portal protein [Lactobacillus pasteurii DSM 23907 = CRBIP 24.76]|uniref:Putative phage portal protein n=2 Tax=Lactobacillus pasteurii TaxID=872327 RepID=I7LDN6_9LACO|nr:Putative phage portal protein [Lactobacillus pasteurii DSM 23907 = CRBIP 24.76]